MINLLDLNLKTYCKTFDATSRFQIMFWNGENGKMLITDDFFLINTQSTESTGKGLASGWK